MHSLWFVTHGSDSSFAKSSTFRIRHSFCFTLIHTNGRTTMDMIRLPPIGRMVEEWRFSIILQKRLGFIRICPQKSGRILENFGYPTEFYRYPSLRFPHWFFHFLLCRGSFAAGTKSSNKIPRFLRNISDTTYVLEKKVILTVETSFFGGLGGRKERGHYASSGSCRLLFYQWRPDRQHDVSSLYIGKQRRTGSIHP